MHFYLIGIDYKSSSIDKRDAIYRDRKKILDFWQNYAGKNSAVLVTCNRIEIYGVAENTYEVFGLIHKFSKKAPDFLKFAYLEHGRERVFAHALRLAVGLESQLKGELQILSQLDSWRVKGVLPKPVGELWDEVLLLAKDLRNTSNLDEDYINVASLVYEDIKNRLVDQHRYSVTVIGTGKIAELFVRHKPLETDLTFVAHKNFEKARKLAESSKGNAVLLNDLKTLLPCIDILISASASPHYLIKKELFRDLKISRGNPIFIYDLATPRDVEPGVSEIPGVFLQNLDDLNYIFARSNQDRKESIDLAANMVRGALANYSKVNIYDKVS